jgi:glycerol-3-phosphate O-acyltransferase 3/4
LFILVVGLASVGASLGLRKMYVKALLKIFEYATNIKQEKVKDCEQILGDDLKSQMKKHKELALRERLRKESFMLKPFKSTSSSSKNSLTDIQDKGLELELKDLEKLREQSDDDEDGYTNVNPIVNRQQINNTSSSNSTTTTLEKDKRADPRSRTLSDFKRDFQLGDIIEFVHNGLDAIVDDDVTKRFTTEELTVWNLLSRTNQQYEYVSFRITVLWLVGFLLRYCFLFPFRLVLFIFGCTYTLFSTFLIGLIKDGSVKRCLNQYATRILHRILSRVFSAIITFHNPEFKAKPGSICVANHTSPIDVIILSTDNCYSMIGQEHSGFTGMMQRAFSRASKHIWFDRSESKDRGLVAKRMADHVTNKNNMPILIFPEGTCINNTSVMMFKKGCFEIDSVIYPVAIKYDQRFGDAFWNSNKHSMLQYLILMMTSWAIVVDVYYLPPMQREENEDASEFASRVKTEIVKKGSFVDLNWDGNLKRSSPKLNLMYEQQQKYFKHLKIN